MTIDVGPEAIRSFKVGDVVKVRARGTCVSFRVIKLHPAEGLIDLEGLAN